MRSAAMRSMTAVGVEHRLGNNRRTRHDAGEDARLVAEGVEEGIDDEIAIARFQADDGGPGAEGAQRLGLRRRRSLGVTGRARGEDEVRGVVGLDRSRPGRRDCGVHRLAGPEELAQAEQRHPGRRRPRPRL